MTPPLFQLKGVTVTLPGQRPGQSRTVLHGVDLEMEEGQTLALTGPSGCGKSMVARTLCGLLPRGARLEGEVWWRGERMAGLEDPAWRNLRGRVMTMVLQEPGASLNPVLRVVDQIAEAVALHQGVGRAESRRRAEQLLIEVQVPDPRLRGRWYPHQLSGGMRQRVLLAAALACNPCLLIADEPTTSLDPTVQRTILSLLDRVRRQRGMALLFISHDRHVVSLLCGQAAVMAEGRVLHLLSTAELAAHETPGVFIREGEASGAGLQARGLVGGYGRPGAGEPVLRGVDLDLMPGQVVGLAGESGCGKTTLARLLCRQLDPWQGSVKLAGRDLGKATGRELARLRRKVQMVFQDPGSSLNPRQKVGAALREAAGDSTHSSSPADLLAETGLGPEMLDRYPHQMSGGQRQRVAVARCLAADPAVVVADEVTSALDEENRRILLELFTRLLVKRGVALLLISHDLDLLTRFCRRVVVMFSGLVVEAFPCGRDSQVYHPYTRELLQASPRHLAEHPHTWDDYPLNTPTPAAGGGSGCPWAPRCPLAQTQCNQVLPDLVEIAPGHLLRCPESKASQPSHFIDT